MLAVLGALAFALPAHPQAQTPHGHASFSTVSRMRYSPKDGAEMVYIPAGAFTMGSTDSEEEQPIRKVMLDGYYIYRTPVTVAQYAAFCRATGYRIPKVIGKPPKRNHPVVGVSYDDALAYCRWASGTKPGSVRLPTEAEWEKAARGTDGRLYPWGNTLTHKRLWYSVDRHGDARDTKPVGTYPSGASPYGVLDMAGNVWQWCSDWYDLGFYASRQATERNPDNQSVGEKKYRVLRGGSWKGNDPINFRSAFRDDFDPTKWDDHSGFRCVFHPDAR